jgi:hypothetical protein
VHSLAALLAIMSFGYSVGEVLQVIQLAGNTVQEATCACGPHDEMTREAMALHKVLERLGTQVADPNGAFNTVDDVRKQELTYLLNGSRRILTTIHSIFAKYNRLAENKNHTSKLWQKAKIGNAENKKLEDIRLKLVICTSAISLFLYLIMSLESQRRVESYLSSQGGELGEIRKSIDLIAAAQAPKSSVDNKNFWRELRRELVKEGFASSAVNKNKQVIQEYLKELGQRGVFDDSEDDDQEKADSREPIHDSKALEGETSENGSSSNDNLIGWRVVKANDQGLAHILVEESSEAGDEIFEYERRSLENYLRKDKKQSRAGEEKREVLSTRMEESGSPHLPPLPYPEQSLADEATFTATDEKRGNEVIQERYEQKLEQYLATYDDSDLASIASYVPSVLSEDSSTSSFSSSPSRGSAGKMPSAALEGVEYILAEPFLSDTAFGLAYIVAIENIGVDRFRRNLTRLLDRYSSGLRKEAQGWLEVNTARVVRPVQSVLFLICK